MNNDGKSNKFITAFIIIVFLILSYTLVKSFFGESKPTSNSIYSKDGSFSFIYDTKYLSDKELNKMYDETRTNKVVANKNYGKTTKDVVKGKLFLKPSNFYYVFSNASKNPKYYKLTIKDLDYISIYKVNETKNYIYLAVLGTDLKYYIITMSINNNTDEINLEDKSWVNAGKVDLSAYDNAYYKVIDEVCNIQVIMPAVYNTDKYSKKTMDGLKDKIIDSISIESIDNFEYNYYSYDQDDIKLSDNITLLLKDSKMYQYYSKNDEKNDISYTTITLIKDNRFVLFTDIDDVDKYNKYLENNGYTYNEHDYKGIKAYTVYQNNKFDSLLLNIDNHYYKVSSIENNLSVNESSIEEWITNYIDGILAIN